MSKLKTILSSFFAIALGFVLVLPLFFSQPAYAAEVKAPSETVLPGDTTIIDTETRYIARNLCSTDFAVFMLQPNSNKHQFIKASGLKFFNSELNNLFTNVSDVYGNDCTIELHRRG